MDILINFFSIDNTFFTVLGYQMSYLEFFGTLLNILSVWLITRNNIWTWPIGIVAVIMFAVLFYQIQLYSDFVEQIYFLITGFYGWWLWVGLSRREQGGKEELKISYLTNNGYLWTILVIGIGTLAAGYFMQNIHIYFPRYFSIPAAFPYLDAFTTVMSFTAQLLIAYKKIESWYLWIFVDVIGIGLYYSRGVVFVSLLYLVFLVLATKGYFDWRRIRSGEAV